MEKSDTELGGKDARSGASDVQEAGDGSGGESADNEDDEDEDERWSSDESEFSDSASVLSDDSVLPPMPDIDEGDGYEEDEEPRSIAAVSLFQACAKNNGPMVRFQLRSNNVTLEEVAETDNNGRTALMVACYSGFVDVVVALAECPYVDVNHQDKEGNTALLLAAQAGHITIINYLLNYYPGVNVEVRNVHGFTALMKAAMQGRSDCVTALMLSGADFTATDPNRGLTPPEWALHTGRWDTAASIRRLLSRPVPEQMRASFCPEWSSLAALVARAVAPRTCMQKLSECLRDTLTINFPKDPEPGGVLDHMVRVSTSLASPFVSTACSTLCPDSPPAVGKRGVSVPELANALELESDSCNGASSDGGGTAPRKKDSRSLKRVDVLVIGGSGSPRRKRPDRRLSMYSTASGGDGVASPAAAAGGAGGRAAAGSYRATYGARTRSLPVNLWRRNSVGPGGEPPRLKLIKASPPGRRRAAAEGGDDATDRRRRRKSKDKHLLDIPKWRYKEIKEEKKRAQEEEENKKKQQKVAAKKA